MNRRQLTLVVSVLGFIIVAGWIIFFFFTKKPGAQPAPPARTPVASLVPTPQQSQAQNPQAQFVKLTDHRVADPQAGIQNVMYFDLTDQTANVMSLALNANQETKLSQTVFEGITDARWSPDRKKIILNSSEYDTRTFYSLDLEQNLQFDLPDFMRDPIWSPDGKLIAFYSWNPAAGQAFIATVKSDGTGEKTIIAPGLGENVRVLWPIQDTLLFYEKPTPLLPIPALFSYSFKTKQLTVIQLPTGESPVYGFEAIPSPDGTMLLMQFSAQNGNAISTYILKGTQMTQAPFSTLTHKCAWTQDSQSIYCAFPKQWNTGTAMLPFDYWRGIISTKDSFAKLNVKTGEFTTYAEQTPYDALSLSVSPDETFLTFINRADRALYKMRIK